MCSSVLLGITQEAIRCTQTSSKLTRTTDSRKQTPSPDHATATKVKHARTSPTAVKNKSSYDREQESPTGYSRVFFKDFSIPKFFGLRCRTIPATIHEGVVSQFSTDIQNNNVVEKNDSSADRNAWFDWLYENEQMMPDLRKRPSAEVISRQEKVDCKQMTEYMNIEPRMR